MRTLSLSFLLFHLVVSISPSALSEEMEREIPGSVEYFARWALMERTIDRIGLVFKGLTPPPRGSKDAMVIAYYTLSTDVEMSDENFQQHMFRIFHITDLVSSAWKSQTMNMFTIPRWFFTELFSRRFSYTDSRESLTRMVAFVKSRTQTTPDPRFPDNRTIRTTVLVWWLFGLPSSLEQSFPATFDQKTDSYTMHARQQQLSLEHLSIISIAR